METVLCICKCRVAVNVLHVGSLHCTFENVPTCRYQDDGMML